MAPDISPLTQRNATSFIQLEITSVPTSTKSNEVVAFRPAYSTSTVYVPSEYTVRSNGAAGGSWVYG